MGISPIASFFEMQMSLYSEWAKKCHMEEHQKIIQEQERHNEMKLSEWLENKSIEEPTIFVDQDNTLLLLSSVEHVARLGNWANNNSTFENIMGHHVNILPRPHSLHFLSECKRMGKVYILTAGTSSFQEEVLRKVKMFDVVDGVFGSDTYHEVPRGKRSILIDNLPHTHPNSVAKLNAMGGGMFLKVPDWEGLNPKDTALMDILPKLRKAFDSLAV